MEAGLKENECVFKIVARNIKNLHYTDDTTLIAKNTMNLQILQRVYSNGFEKLSTKIKEHGGGEEMGLKLNKKKAKEMTTSQN